MSAKLLRLPEQPSDLSQQNVAPVQEPAAGWDPYEVWRTRVLLPRLEESASVEPKPAVERPALVRR